MQIKWDVGTAYDFFISLHALYHPDRFGLRGAWAAGVRSRLPLVDREFLQEIQTFLPWPLHWVYDQLAEKTAVAVLTAVAAIPAAQRLPILATVPGYEDINALYRGITAKGQFDKTDEQTILTAVMKHRGERAEKINKKEFRTYLNWWTSPAEFGEMYLSAMQSYYDAFFAEEEARILPALEESLARGQALAQTLPLPDLLEELSQGVQYSAEPNVPEVILAPSFWGSPLLIYGERSERRWLLLFGGRPSTASLIPGELVPDALAQALKALADPTRLRILRFLMAEPLTPAELARRLRLRPPTVIHHLHALRLARLVQLTISGDGRRYQARREAIPNTFALLNTFLGSPK